MNVNKCKFLLSTKSYTRGSQRKREREKERERERESQGAVEYRTERNEICAWDNRSRLPGEGELIWVLKDG